MKQFFVKAILINLNVMQNQLLSEIEIKHLKYLSELIDYGSSLLMNISKQDFTKLQNFLLFNHVAINNFSEGIYILCLDARPYPAYVILRSLFEAYTNTEYIKQGDSTRKLSLYAKEGFSVRKTIANEFEGFVKKYPERKNSLSVLKDPNIQDLKNFTEKYIGGIDLANKFQEKESYPDLLSKSREIDKNNDGANQKGESELNYGRYPFSCKVIPNF